MQGIPFGLYSHLMHFFVGVLFDAFVCGSATNTIWLVLPYDVYKKKIVCGRTTNTIWLVLLYDVYKHYLAGTLSCVYKYYLANTMWLVLYLMCTKTQMQGIPFGLYSHIMHCIPVPLALLDTHFRCVRVCVRACVRSRVCVCIMYTYVHTYIYCS